MTSVESWRPVVGWEERYEVSDLGRVRNARTGRVLAQTAAADGRYGYRKAGLWNGRQTTRLVHQLVLEAFVGPRPPGMQACHGPQGSSSNALSNLRWDTPSANIADSVRGRTHRNARKDTDPLGHSLAEPNRTASARRRGVRKCLACERARSRQAKAAAAGRPFDFRAVADAIYAEIMAGHAAPPSALDSSR